MNIEILKYLQQYPKKPNSQAGLQNVGISTQDISVLESQYNNGIKFPLALKELLFLAGEFCYVLDYNIFETQQELQEAVREWLSENNLSINRPFFAIDAYNYGETFLFVYLDEGDNPIIRQAYLFPRKDMAFITNLLGQSLSEYIKSQIDDVKQGINPF
jgi:hypothetical protein